MFSHAWFLVLYGETWSCGGTSIQRPPGPVPQVAKLFIQRFAGWLRGLKLKVYMVVIILAFVLVYTEATIQPFSTLNQPAKPL
jgi:hypothetical protein